MPFALAETVTSWVAPSASAGTVTSSVATTPPSAPSSSKVRLTGAALIGLSFASSAARPVAVSERVMSVGLIAIFLVSSLADSERRRLTSASCLSTCFVSRYPCSSSWMAISFSGSSSTSGSAAATSLGPFFDRK